MAAKEHGGLDIIVESAKRDPRFSKMKGGDYDEPEADGEEMEGDEEGGDAGLDALKRAFPAEQAKAIQAYVDACMK